MLKRCFHNHQVVNARTNEVEQTTHYYPYGGIIGNLSSNQEAQKYKYSNKELDRTYGLDLYDFQARLFNPALPVFDRPDEHAASYYPISPYAYCAGDPVNCVDPTGKWILGINNEKVTLINDNWSSNVTSSIEIVCGAMMKSEIGTKLVNDMLNADYPISINIVNGYYQEWK